MRYELFERQMGVIADRLRHTLSPETMAEYFAHLRHIDDASFEGATRRLFVSCEFMPSPAQIKAEAHHPSGGDGGVRLVGQDTPTWGTHTLADFDWRKMLDKPKS